MKKIVCLLIALSCLLTLVACTEDEPDIVTTEIEYIEVSGNQCPQIKVSQASYVTNAVNEIIKSEVEIYLEDNKNRECFIDTFVSHTERYISIVLWMKSIPNYGTDGEIFSICYDTVNQTVILPEIYLAENGYNTDSIYDALQTIEGYSYYEYYDADGIFIDNSGNPYLIVCGLNHPTGGDYWKKIWFYNLKEKSLVRTLPTDETSPDSSNDTSVNEETTNHTDEVQNPYASGELPAVLSHLHWYNYYMDGERYKQHVLRFAPTGGNGKMTLGKGAYDYPTEGSFSGDYSIDENGVFYGDLSNGHENMQIRFTVDIINETMDNAEIVFTLLDASLDAYKPLVGQPISFYNNPTLMYSEFIAAATKNEPIWADRAFDTLTITYMDGKTYILGEWLASRDTRATMYTVMDLDGDGAKETILWLARGTDEYHGYAILYKGEDGKVYAQALDYKQFHSLMDDGSFSFSGIDNPSISGIATPVFSNGSFRKDELAFREDDVEGITHYYVDGKEVEKPEYDAHMHTYTGIRRGDAGGDELYSPYSGWVDGIVHKSGTFSENFGDYMKEWDESIVYERGTRPALMYYLVGKMNLTREDLEAYYGDDTPEYIYEGLLTESLAESMQLLKSPYAFYHEGNLYTVYDVFDMYYRDEYAFDIDAPEYAEVWQNAKEWLASPDCTIHFIGEMNDFMADRGEI